MPRCSLYCTASPETPLPSRMPQVVWRAGLDLNPLDVTDPEQSAWLETLVWPEQTERLAGLRGALRVAAAQKPRLVEGSLTGNALRELCREAPANATLVVFHTAVLAYVTDHTDRRNFADSVLSLCPYWICNESASCHARYSGPCWQAKSGRPLPIVGQQLTGCLDRSARCGHRMDR